LFGILFGIIRVYDHSILKFNEAAKNGYSYSRFNHSYINSTPNLWSCYVYLF